MGEFGADERAVSESVGVVILVGMTIVVTATLGLNVLLVSDDDASGTTANFSYDYVDSNNALIITHVRGNEFPASELHIVGENGETTWAAAANVSESEPIGPGDVIQVSGEGSYGAPVTKQSGVRIYHERAGNRTQLSEWP